jgi:hypothetical protein
LAQAEERIWRAGRNIERQRKIVAGLERDGRDATAARDLLRQFEELQAMHNGERARLLAELAT